ncbi:MAG: plastocyanin/azurin family copper-binding protein [Phycisphaerales bacterium]|nr:plastocyanin/azurin family copper-binding protein [Phycisphaerales bacterium]
MRLLTILTTLLGTVAFGQEPAPTRPEDRPVPTTQAALDTFILPDGYAINCFASEEDFPELSNPIAMTFDGGGRLWVAVAPTYPHLEPGESPRDKLLVFEDVDGDGRADKQTIFADGLYIPTGFVLGDGGAYVVSQPNLLHLRDTDGDLVADEQEIVLHGFGAEDSHHAMSAFTWGHDGAMYFNEGTFHHTQIETPWGPRRLRHGGVIRYKPDTEEVDVVVSFPFANPWGHTIDRWGQSVISDASNGYNYCLAHLMGAHTYPDEIKGQGPYRNIRSFTPGGRRPASGSEFIRSRHLPDDVQGRFVSSQCIGFHGLRWYDLEEVGSGWKTEALPMELLQSTDTSFRPVSMQVGPDGAFYVLDWANPIVGHMQFNVRDDRRDHTHGRVWRITYPDRPLSTPPAIEGASTLELLEFLKAYENRTRALARRALQEGDPSEVLPEVDAWVSDLDPTDPDYEHHLVEALWIHQGHNDVDESLLEQVLTANDPHARMAGMRVLRWWLDEVDDPFPMLERGVLDRNERVRLEAVAALGHVPDVRAAELAGLATSQPMDQDFEVTFNRTLAALKPWGTPMGEGTAAWRLQQLEEEALLAEPLDHFVARERLRRPGLQLAEREAALQWMAERTDRTHSGELVHGLRQLNPDRDALDDGLGMLLNVSRADLVAQRSLLLEIADDPEAAPRLREAAWAAIAIADGDLDQTWKLAGTLPDSRRARRELLASMRRLMHRDDALKVRDQAWELAVSMLPERVETEGGKQTPRGRFVRISLPRPGTITLAEVQVDSGGKNAALGKEATQSSTGWEGHARLALDGKTSGVFSDGTSTHTREDDEDPYWEVDLGSVMPIDAVTIWGRSERPYDQRLTGHTIEILDNDRVATWSATDLPAPQFNTRTEPGSNWDRALVEAAMLTMTSTPGRGQAAMEQLMPYVTSSGQPDLQLLAVESIQTVPSTYWTEEDQAWQIKDVDIATVADRMIYDIKRFDVTAGTPVRIKLTNDDSMPHNLLVCKPGSMRKVGIAADNLGTGPDAVALNYVPDMKEIMHVLALVEPGETHEVLFIAPDRPGRYPYVCTFPGHWPMMNGVMTVKRRR